MGHQRHHIIVVTTWDRDAVNMAHWRAKETFVAHNVTKVHATDVNGIYTFMIFPDGSQEFWPESEAGDKRRAAFKKFLDSTRTEEGSSRLTWAEVQYGDDNGMNMITNSDDDYLFDGADSYVLFDRQYSTARNDGKHGPVSIGVSFIPRALGVPLEYIEQIIGESK